MDCEEVYMDAESLEQEVSRFPAGLHLAERKPRVLLVEDDVDMRRLVAAVLRKDGCEVIEVDSGVAMLRRIESTIWRSAADYFDVIVSDIQMPDVTALEVLRNLRCRNITTPVILMTAYGNDHARNDARALGAVALLDKPLDWKQLRAAVRRAVLR
jgi:CheY-like chemotaxis protein